jgi:tripartite-type tricarboxylate transporter receptor subunit TctC
MPFRGDTETMTQVRFAAVLAGLVVLSTPAAPLHAQAGAAPSASPAASPSAKLLTEIASKIPDAVFSDGRASVDRSAAKGEGPLAPSGLVLSTPMVLLGTKTLQAQDASELVAWMKAKNRAVRVGHAGAWSASLECALQLQDVLESKLTLVAAAGPTDAMSKLKTGAIDVLCDAVPNVIDDVRSGEAVAFVLASDERLPALWDVATADQAGLPLFSATAWLGLYAATPGSAITAYSKALSEDVSQTLSDAGWIAFSASYQTSDAHKQQLASDAERRKSRLTDDGLPAAP